MNIVHTEASCGWGGQEMRILSEAAGLIRRGHQVRLLCAPESRIYAEAARYGVPATALPIARKNLKGLLALRRWLSDQRPKVDVINTHSSTDSWLAALACATLADAPAIVRTRHISAPVPDNVATRWLYTKATRHIVTAGEKLRQSLIEDNGYPPGNISSVPTGIAADRFFPGDKLEARRRLGLLESRHYIGIVATLRSWKGHLYLLDAFARIAQERVGWQLLIVGDGPMRDVIAPKIAELGLEQKVILAGQQEAPEFWLRALDIFCLPSYANEGVPQAVIQAMMSALPVVTTPVGSITEAVEDGVSGLLVAPQDAQALRAALLGLIDDPERAQALGQAARSRAVAQFAESAMLDRMEQIFQTVGQGAGR